MIAPPPDLPPPPIPWRARTFAAISILTSAIAVFWGHVELIRHNAHVGYDTAFSMVVHSDRWWLNVVLAAALAPLYFVSIWSWWRFWRRGRTKAQRILYTITKVLGTLIAAYFVRLIIVGFAARPAALLTESPALLVVFILLASSYAVPIGLWIAWWTARLVSRSVAV